MVCISIPTIAAFRSYVQPATERGHSVNHNTFLVKSAGNIADCIRQHDPTVIMAAVLQNLLSSFG
jgi:hypothetical protein